MAKNRFNCHCQFVHSYLLCTYTLFSKPRVCLHNFLIKLGTFKELYEALLISSLFVSSFKEFLLTTSRVTSEIYLVSRQQELFSVFKETKFMCDTPTHLLICWGLLLRKQKPCHIATNRSYVKARKFTFDFTEL